MDGVSLEKMNDMLNEDLEAIRRVIDYEYNFPKPIQNTILLRILPKYYNSIDATEVSGYRPLNTILLMDLKRKLTGDQNVY